MYLPHVRIFLLSVSNVASLGMQNDGKGTNWMKGELMLKGEYSNITHLLLQYQTNQPNNTENFPHENSQVQNRRHFSCSVLGNAMDRLEQREYLVPYRFLVLLLPCYPIYDRIMKLVSSFL